MNRSLHNIPFAPARCPFFYGWFLLLAGTVGIIFSSPGQTIGIAAFTEPLMDSLQINRTLLSLAYGAGTAASGLLLTLAGKLYDRLGARWSSAIAAGGMGFALLGLSHVEELVRALVRLSGDAGQRPIAVTVLVVGFFLLRFFGQGLMTLGSRNMVMQWFVHRRGLANGLMGVCIGLAFSSTPPLFNALIERLSWQGAWELLGWVTLLAFTPFVLVFFRHQPEECGLLPDNGRAPGCHDPAHEPTTDFTLEQAVRTGGFWVFTLALALSACYMTAFAFHVESLLGQIGFPPGEAYGVFLPAAVIAVVLGLTAGWISDHIKLQWLLLVMLLGMALSMTGLLIGIPRITFLCVVIGNGVSSATFGPVIGVHCARFFGRKHLGAISGLQMTFNVLASAAGPALFALSLRFTGSYQTGLFFCLAAAALLTAAIQLARPPLSPPTVPFNGTEK